MMTFDQAAKHAAHMEMIHGEPWLVFRTPDGALCNQPVYNLHNTGRYAACRASEKSDYEAGGAIFTAEGD